MAITGSLRKSGLEVQAHLTGQGRPRPDLSQILASTINPNHAPSIADKNHQTWVYISGPKGFIAAGKKACEEENIKAGGNVVEIFAASWDP